MANAETTYADRLGRAIILKESVEGFIPAYAPVDAELTLANFQILLGMISTKNAEVGNLKDTYSTEAGVRVAVVKDLKARSRGAKNFVISTKTLKKYHSTVKRSCAKITSSRTKKTVIPSDPSTPENQKKRNKGEQSYADIAGNFENLISLLTDIGVGYAPFDADLTIANLTTVHTDLLQKSKDLGEFFGQVSVAVKERFDLYNDDEGLREKKKAIKAAVKSQYGADSAQFNAIKGIKL